MNDYKGTQYSLYRNQYKTSLKFKVCLQPSKFYYLLTLGVFNLSTSSRKWPDPQGNSVLLRNSLAIHIPSFVPIRYEKLGKTISLLSYVLTITKMSSFFLQRCILAIIIWRRTAEKFPVSTGICPIISSTCNLNGMGDNSSTTRWMWVVPNYSSRPTTTEFNPYNDTETCGKMQDLNNTYIFHVDYRASQAAFC